MIGHVSCKCNTGGLLDLLRTDKINEIIDGIKPHLLRDYPEEHINNDANATQEIYNKKITALDMIDTITEFVSLGKRKLDEFVDIYKKKGKEGLEQFINDLVNKEHFQGKSIDSGVAKELLVSFLPSTASNALDVAYFTNEDLVLKYVGCVPGIDNEILQ